VWSNDFVYELPVRRFSSRGLNLLLGGWQVNGILQFFDGLPFTPAIGGANPLNGEPTRPDRVAAGTPANPTVNAWFDTAAFPAVPLSAFRFGNSGRNILIGPGRVTVDMGLLKDFPLWDESHRLQFRFEAFNAPNRANFGLPNPAVDQETAGAIRSADVGRQLQFGLKYLF
jgi:hypothetical protein